MSIFDDLYDGAPDEERPESFDKEFETDGIDMDAKFGEKKNEDQLLESPQNRKVLSIFYVVFAAVLIIIAVRSWQLQVARGSHY